jgi:hypothetical protein
MNPRPNRTGQLQRYRQPQQRWHPQNLKKMRQLSWSWTKRQWSLGHRPWPQRQWSIQCRWMCCLQHRPLQVQLPQQMPWQGWQPGLQQA